MDRCMACRWLAAVGVLAWSAAGPARAQGPAALTFNAAVVSDYRYRGISQSRLRPAVQGGADCVHGATGWYAGTWLSTIRWIRDAGGDGRVEWDVYGGRRGKLGGLLTYDAGALAYLYPRAHLRTDPHTLELYGQLGYGPAYLKYSHATSNLFGVPDSHRSGYLDVGASIDLGHGVALQLHAGRQRVRHHGSLSYNDYRAGIAKAWGASTLTLAAVGADTAAYASPSGKDLGKTAITLTVTHTFQARHRK